MVKQISVFPSRNMDRNNVKPPPELFGCIGVKVPSNWPVQTYHMRDNRFVAVVSGEKISLRNYGKGKEGGKMVEGKITEPQYTKCFLKARIAGAVCHIWVREMTYFEGIGYLSLKVLDACIA